METWTKYTYICDPDECDSLIELTFKDTYGFPSGSIYNATCPCGRKPDLLSVADATIYPTQKKEENMNGLTIENLPLSLAEQYNPTQLITYKVVTDGEVSYENKKVSELEWDLDQFRKIRKAETAWWGKESKLRNIITEVYQDSQDQDTLFQIAEIFDIPLTKTIEYTATINVSGTMEVDLTDTYDLSDMLFSNLNVTGYGEVEVADFDIYSVEEC